MTVRPAADERHSECPPRQLRGGGPAGPDDEGEEDSAACTPLIEPIGVAFEAIHGRGGGGRSADFRRGAVHARARGGRDRDCRSAARRPDLPDAPGAEIQAVPGLHAARAPAACTRRTDQGPARDDRSAALPDREQDRFPASRVPNLVFKRATGLTPREYRLRSVAGAANWAGKLVPPRRVERAGRAANS